MHVAWLRALSFVLCATGCGGSSVQHGASSGAAGASSGAAGASGGAAGAGGGSAAAGAGAGAGGRCPEPASMVPDVAPFEPPPENSLGSFQVTFQNRCTQTVWPARGSGEGLDNSVIDTQLWFPLLPAGDRTVTVYGGVRHLGFWGRTGCHFDREGAGTCQTGDCNGFVCPIVVNDFPADATIFLLEAGFLAGYNLALRVEGAACGEHECVTDVSTCSPAFSVKNACGRTIACTDQCGVSECCTATESACGAEQFHDTPDSDHLVITFCP